VITVPANATVEATGPTGAAHTYVVSGTDLFDGSVAVSCTPASGSTFPFGANTVTCTATDSHANVATKTFTVTVADTTAPVITVPANTSVEATGPTGAGFIYTASAVDAFDGGVAVTCTPASGSTFPFGANTVTCTGTDAHTNVATKTFTVTVTDTTAPVITVPANATVEATGPTGAAHTYVVSGTDLFDGSVAVSCTPASGSTFPFGANTVTCTATDSHANVATKTFTVTVADTTAPVITVPANTSVEATGPTGAAFTYTASAVDAFDGGVSVTCTPASGSTFPFGANTVTCTATDSHANVAMKTFTVTVADTTAPVITVPASASVEATGPSGAAFTYTVLAVDTLDGVVAANCTPTSGSAFPFGTTTVTCTAIDSHANVGTNNFTVTVTDITAPVVTISADAASVEATDPTGAAFTYTVSAVDALDGFVGFSCAPASGSTFPLGATMVACITTDSHANVRNTSFTVVVTDTTAPVITVPANATVEATTAAGAAFSYTVSAADAFDGSVAVNCTPSSGSTFLLGATTVTCTATDSHANVGTKTFTVMVTDSTAPVITVPANTTVQATSAAGAAFNYTAFAVDAFDGLVAVTCTPASGATFPFGATTVACAATDSHANVGTKTFTVTVIDSTAPVITVPANATVEATGPAGAAFSYTVSAVDAVDGGVAVNCTPASGATFPAGVNTVTCSATDSRANVGTNTFTVTVTDTTAPVITVPPNATIEATSPAGAPHTYVASATDLLDGSVAVNCTPASGSIFPFGTTTVACTATDGHANVATRTFTVTVIDTTAPVITVPANATVEATGPSGAAFTYIASATDNFDSSVTVSCTPPSGATFPLDTTTVTCTASDVHGNSAVAKSFTVTVRDTTAPSLTLPPNATVDTPDPTGAVFTFDATANDLVDGSGTTLVQQGNLVYEGAFRVPAGFFRGPNLTQWQFDRATFEYGGTSLAFNPANNSLFVVGHDQAQIVSEIAIPPLVRATSVTGLNTASLLQPFTDATDQRLSLVSSDPLNPPDVTIKVGGLLPYQNKLFVSAYIYYDGRSSQTLSHFVSGLDLRVAGDAIGPFQVNRPDCNPVTKQNCLGAGFFSGYFARVPAAWQPSLGGPILNGNCCLGVISRTSYGPALFAIDPMKLGIDVPLPAKPLVYYPPAHPLLEPGLQPCIDQATCQPLIDGWSQNSALFNGTSEVRGAVFPEGTHSVLMFGRQGGFGASPGLPGNGAFCYGFGTNVPALVGTIPPGEADRYCYDPEDGSKGVHGYPYRYYVWAYNASDLAAAAAGTVDPWTVRPYAVWPLTIPIPSTGSTHLGGAAYDPQSGRIYISQYQGDANLPVIHALKLHAVACAPESGTRFPIGTTTVQCSATDGAGNRATGSFTVTVNLIDVTPPVVTAPANAIVEAAGPAGAAYSFAASATDSLDGPLTASCTPASGSTFPLGVTTVSCSATDAHGNTGTASFTVTVTDTTRPIVTVPANAIVEATGPAGAAFSFSTSATDNIDGPLAIVICNPVNGATFPLGTTTVTCTATDAHGNAGTNSFTVTVRDTTAPTLTLPNATAEATSAAGAIVALNATAVDAVDGNVAVNCTPASGSTFPLGVTTVTCSATDTRGNLRTGSLTVTVQDTTGPVVTVPTSPTIEATSASGAVFSFTPSATDSVSGNVPVSCTPASGTTFPIGTTTVTCSATDARANVGTKTFTVTVRDTTAPTLTVAANAIVEATGATGATVNYAAATASDIVDGSVPASCAPASGATFPIGTTTVTCTATDAHGNVGTKTFTVLVRDTTAPAVTVPANAIVEATAATGATFTFTPPPAASDIVDGPRPVSCTPASGATFPIATTTVTCSATDTRGNTGTNTFTVTVRDTTAPTVTVPANATVEATLPAGATFTYTASATDSVDGARAVSCNPASGATFPIATTTVTCSATDTRGNTGTNTFTVTVRDTTGPVVTVPSNATVEATAATGATFSYTASASDIVDGVRVVSCLPASGATFPLGVTTVTCTASDTRANTGGASFTVTVRDTTPPVITVPANTNLGATGPGGAIFTYTATAVDAVDGSVAVTCVPPSGSTFPIGTTTVTCSAADTRLNASSASFTVTVTDITAPTVTITAPANGAIVSGASVTVSATSGAAGIIGVQFKIDGLNLGAEDTTSPYSVIWNTTASANGSHTLTANLRDVLGRTATSTVTVTVNNATGAVDLSVDGNQRFQTIAGFMVNANSAQWNNGQLTPALDMLIDQGVGVYRVIIDKQDWESTNDNADPNVFNWTFYNTVYTSPKFEKLWSTIAYLNQKGITSGILLNFMGPGPAWMGAPFITAGLEDEWVETIASLVYYAKVTRNLQFTLLGPANEVDWDGIEGPRVGAQQYALLLHKLALKLDALGLSDIRFVGPDTAQGSVFVTDYLPWLLADSTAMAKLQHFGFHNYADNAFGADAAIKASAYPTRDFWVTEAGMGNDYYGPDHLISQMQNGATSAGVWDAYTSVYNHRANDGNPMIDLVNNVWVARHSFYAFKQLFKFAQPGAIRIGATISGANLDAVAFYNPSSGQVTVFGHNHTGSRNVKISLANLPVTGAMQVYMTDLSREFERQPDATIVNGVVTVLVDLDGYFTVTVSTVPDTTPPAVTMLAPANNATVSGNAVTVSAGASDNVGVAGVQFKLDGANLGAEVATSPYSIVWNTTTASNALHTLTAVARDMSGNTATATAVSVTVNNPVDVTPPTVSMTAPANGANVSGSNVPVSATAADDVGVVGVQFLLDGSPLGAEVTTAPYTIAWDATTTTLGSHTLAARARDASGKQTTSALVTVTVIAPPPGVLAIDAMATGTAGFATSSISSNTFSTTSANELLLAFIGTDDAVATPAQTVTGVTGGGLTWVLVQRTNTRRGTAEIWRAFASTPKTNMSVTATLAQSAAGLLQVVTFTGVDTTGTNGSGAIGAKASGSKAPPNAPPTASLTTTRNNSWVWGVGVDWDRAVSRTIGPNQTMVQEYLAPALDTYWVQRQTAVTPTAGTVVTINDTAPTNDQYNLTIVEILPRP
jgi:O-glycosyl hydrolase